jgi:hypothetical protein
MRMIDLTGTTFNRWTVVSRAANTAAGQAQWRCRCDCGTERELKSIVIRRGISQSCGCLKIERIIERTTTHGHAANGMTPTYHSWASMIARCTNPNKKEFPEYGGRGITVCERWRWSFQNFLDDMGEKPPGRFSLDRIDNSGGYEPGNCRWATDVQQANNKRPMRPWRLFTFNGETLPIAEWAARTGINERTLEARLNRLRWPVERALTTPTQLQKRNRRD